MSNGRDPGGTAPDDGDAPGVEPGLCDDGAERDPEGPPLPSEMRSRAVGEISGVTDPAGSGVAVAGSTVGRGVGLGVGRGMGTGVGGGVGAVTTTGPAVIGVGFAPLVLTARYVTVQLPTGSVELPVQVSCPALTPPPDSGTVRPATDTVTLLAVVVPLWNCTEY
jgi:hypothetical protein